eukprot:TRINITY_DN3946_c0_g1_i1.p1 TRINITY_DN3946_c0_g1~~TRINITY_DN3946_c0_g1_i1.p1  ORF type:complete len:652 (-),score=115.19 TRINITY_DN3946_c0_g1_i1:61-2016(-)
MQEHSLMDWEYKQEDKDGYTPNRINTKRKRDEQIFPDHIPQKLNTNVQPVEPFYFYSDQNIGSVGNVGNIGNVTNVGDVGGRGGSIQGLYPGQTGLSGAQGIRPLSGYAPVGYMGESVDGNMYGRFGGQNGVRSNPVNTTVGNPNLSPSHIGHSTSPVGTPVYVDEESTINLGNSEVPILVDAAFRQIQSINNDMVSLRNYISSVPVPLQPDATDYLFRIVGILAQSITNLIKDCEDIESQYILDPEYLKGVSTIIKDLRLHEVQLDLYSREIQNLYDGTQYGIQLYATLYISEQPFPNSIKQNSTVPVVDVMLLTRARSVVTPISRVTAELIHDWTLNTKKNSSPVKNDEEYINKSTMVASFKNMKFTVGSSLKTVQMKFRVNVEVTDGSKNCETMPLETSIPTDHFIIITHTKQWAESQGILLKRDMFQGLLEITSAKFCNVLQRYYLEATKQKPEQPERILTYHEFSFFFSSKLEKPFYDPNATITQKEFDTFWGWFGTTLRELRFNKLLLAMWNQGLVCGMISKQEAQDRLQNYGAGTFLIRFSERQSGALAVAYKQSNSKCRHYLLKNEDINGQGHSLPIFIRDSPSLIQFLACSYVGNERRFSPVDKYQALEQIGQNKKPRNDMVTTYYDDSMFALEIGMNELYL